MLSDAVKLRILEKIGAHIRDEAKRKCPVDNGILRNSLYYRVEGDSVFVGSQLPYAVFVEYGTGEFHLDADGNPEPHSSWEIKPKSAKALKFEVNGNSVFSKKVIVPGMHAQPFLRPALHGSYGFIKQVVRDELSK